MSDTDNENFFLDCLIWVDFRPLLANPPTWSAGRRFEITSANFTSWGCLIAPQDGMIKVNNA
jgi:hypothetical protein